MAEALNILEGYDLKAAAARPAEHLYLEASRLALPTATPIWPIPNSSTRPWPAC
jgi:gamma-glutamyltranspeptidase